MKLNVNQRVQKIATFRFIEVRLMEIAAAWTPTSAEMEMKVMLGRHIWDFAQHADALGKRTFEMRRPEQFSQRPVEAYVRLLEDTARVEGTGERLAALYDGLLPALAQRYQGYLDATDGLLDAPSSVIIERILGDLRRQRQEAEALRRELGLSAPLPVAALREAEQAIVDPVAYQEATA
jgi:hypothetical protein